MKTIQGTSPPAGWRLNFAEIHVWTMSLDASAAALGVFGKILSPSELERARNFRFDLHRNRFIAGRGFMRTLLSRYLQMEPAELEFVYGPNGKPFLAGVSAPSWLNFNLAHSENLALLAVTRAGAVGIDVERIRPLSDAGQVAASFFSARESAAFQKLPPEQKPAAFFKIWTRKEAWLKATGEGIGHLLKAVEVSFLPGEQEQFIGLPEFLPAMGSWVLHSLDPAPGFVAALAIDARKESLRCCHWDEAATSKVLGFPAIKPT